MFEKRIFKTKTVNLSIVFGNGDFSHLHLQFLDVDNSVQKDIKIYSTGRVIIDNNNIV